MNNVCISTSEDRASMPSLPLNMAYMKTKNSKYNYLNNKSFNIKRKTYFED